MPSVIVNANSLRPLGKVIPIVSKKCFALAESTFIFQMMIYNR